MTFGEGRKTQDPVADVHRDLQDALDEAMAAGRLRGIALIRRDGVPIAQRLSPNSDARRLAAFVASIVGAARLATVEFRHGELLQVLIGGSRGQMIAVSAGAEALLIAFLDEDSNLGLAMMALSQASSRVAEAMGSK